MAYSLKKLPPEIRQHIVVREFGCYDWVGTKNDSGYGYITYKGTFWYIHRLTYKLLKGSIPRGYQVHHKCHRRQCCNPAHLQAVSKKEHELITLGYRIGRRLGLLGRPPR